MNNNVTAKQQYIAPMIERVELDNEISLALESTPPDNAPGEGYLMAPDYFKNDPFKGNLA